MRRKVISLLFFLIFIIPHFNFIKNFLSFINTGITRQIELFHPKDH